MRRRRSSLEAWLIAALADCVGEDIPRLDDSSCQWSH
jgi:hypothetical protein